MLSGRAALRTACYVMTLYGVLGQAPELPPVKKELRIAWLAPSEPFMGLTAASSVNVLKLGLRTAEYQFLRNHYIRVKWYDTKCTPKASLAAAVDARQDFNPHMILGPPCSSGMDIVAMLAAHWNIPVFGWVSNGHTLADRTIYSTLVRVMGPLNHFSSSMNHVNVVFKWRTFALIHDVNEAYKSVNEAISMFLKKANNTVTSEHSVSPTQEDKKVEEMFQQIRKYARVLVFSVPWLTMRKYMLVAHRLGMTEGDFVFICINADIYSPSVLHRDILSDVGWRRNDPHDEEARIAFESVILIMMAVSNLEVYGTFEQYVNTASRLQSPDWELPTGNESFDAYAPFIYDATTLWASVVNKTLAEGGDPMNGTRICDLTKEITRTGITGKVVIDNNGDRLSNIWFLDMASNGKFSEIIKITKDLRGALLETSDNVRWPNGMMGNENAPPDTPVCGFEGELCKKKEEIPPPPDYTDSIVGAAAGSSFVFIVAVVVQVSLRHYRRRRQLESLLWQVRFDEIDFVTALLSGSVRSSFRNLARRRATSSKKVNKVRTAVSLQNPNNLQDTVNLNDAVTGLQHLFEAGSVMFGSVAYVRGSLVSVKRISQESVSLTKDLLQQLNKLMELKHQNITAFVGACVDPGRILLLWEYCPKGSLQDIIWNQNIKLDQLFKFALCQDVTKGLEYIHKSAVNYHGNLKSSNCVVDSRWTCKLTDFGVPKLRAVVKAAIPVEENFDKEFWTAPEVLRGQREVDLQKSDIFSLGVIFKEVFTRSSAYVEFNFMNPYDIIERVKTPRDSLFRPLISREVKQNQELSQLIADCWAEDPGVRPSASRLLKMLSKLNPSKHMTMIDNMLAMLEKYANHLEELVAERTSELDAEKRKTENLLYRMLPQSVAEDLKLGKPVKAELFDQVTIYFSDIVGFTGICSESTPIEVVNLLNSLYTLFDDIITGYDVYKVETIGDAYMLASGLPKRNGSQHTKEIANASLDILASIGNFRIPHLPDRKLRIRIGIHTGPVVAGVVGLAMPRYCLFGDAVNTASRMESTGLPLRIHMSHSAKESLQSFSGYHIEYRGEIEVKGKGKMQTYFLKGSDNFYKILPNPDIYTEHSPKMATRNVTSAPNFDNVKDSSPTETSRLKVSESFLLTKPELALIQDIKTYSAKLRRSDSVRSRENIYSRQSFTEHFRRRCSADEGEMPYRVNVISGSALTSEHRSGDCYDVIETPPEGRGVNSAGETNSSSKTTSLEGSGLEKSREALRTKERKGQGQTSDFDDSRTVTDKDAQQLETSHPPSLNPDENLSTGQIIKSCLKTGKHEQTRIGRTDRRLSVEFAIQDDQMDYLFGPKSPDCNNSNLGGKNESALRPLEMTANIFEPIRNGLKSLEEKFIQSHAVHKPGDVLGIRQPKLENTEHRNSPVSSRSSSPKPDFGLLKEQVATRINKARETTSF